jgi:hypothetical protein
VVESRPPLPLRLRVLNTVGKHLGAARLPFAALDEEALVEAVVKATGLTEFGNGYDRVGLLPIGTVRDIYDHYGLAWSEEFEERLNYCLQQNPRGMHGAHLYAPETFGQTGETISERFAAYIKRFELTSPNGIH